MKKCGKVKNPCKICFQTVTAKNGLRCLGACKKWAHFKCLNYTPGKIQDIKAGLIKVNCPCPDCSKEPKEVLTNPPYSCGKLHCPVNKKPVCEIPDCPANKLSGSTQTDRLGWDCPGDCESIGTSSISLRKKSEKICSPIGSLEQKESPCSSQQLSIESPCCSRVASRSPSQNSLALDSPKCKSSCNKKTPKKTVTPKRKDSPKKTRSSKRIKSTKQKGKACKQQEIVDDSTACCEEKSPSCSQTSMSPSTQSLSRKSFSIISPPQRSPRLCLSPKRSATCQQKPEQLPKCRSLQRCQEMCPQPIPMESPSQPFQQLCPQSTSPPSLQQNPTKPQIRCSQPPPRRPCSQAPCKLPPVLSEEAKADCCSQPKCRKAHPNEPSDCCARKSQSVCCIKPTADCEQPNNCCQSKSDSNIMSSSEAHRKLLNAIDQMCCTVGQFSNQFKELMCKMMAALEKCSGVP